MNISIHAPTWGATLKGTYQACRRKFQSTHPRGVRRRCPTVSITGSDFNPRTHVGCDITVCRFTPNRWNFNPRTHVGCDALSSQFRSGGQGISIHAPTWGATPPQEVGVRPIGISIHAPTWGATLWPSGLQLDGDISIHAPTWGATRKTRQGSEMLRFQSTHPRGVRHFPGRFSALAFPFQSTHPRGVRHRGGREALS